MCLFVYIFAVFVVIKQKHWITFQFHWWGSSAVIFRPLRVFHFDRGTSPEPFDAKILKMQRMHRGLKANIKGWYWFVKGNMQAVCRVILNVGECEILPVLTTTFLIWWHLCFHLCSSSSFSHLQPASSVFSVFSHCFRAERDRTEPGRGMEVMLISVCVCGFGVVSCHCHGAAIITDAHHFGLTLCKTWMRVAELWLKVQTVYLSDFRSF